MRGWGSTCCQIFSGRAVGGVGLHVRAANETLQARLTRLAALHIRVFAVCHHCGVRLALCGRSLARPLDAVPVTRRKPTCRHTKRPDGSSSPTTAAPARMPS